MAQCSAAVTAVSLFSGCGGFDWGVQEAGVEIVWANDNNKVAAAAYRRLFPNTEFVEDDIRNVESFPRADMLIGCYPCTGFSLGARRRWRGEDRDLRAENNNFLYREFIRAIGDVQPKVLFVENVRGMLTADKGWFLEKQVEGFEKAGYRVAVELLDAHDFGVAQTRKRVFIVGVLEELEQGYEFPHPNVAAKALVDVIGGMPEWPEGEYLDYKFHGHYLTRNRKRDWAEPSFSIVANARHVPLHPMGEPMQYIEKDRWALCGEENRRLSWRECAAIQGLPGQLDFDGPLEGTYRVIGNAVPPAFGEQLALAAIPIINV